MAQYGKVYVEYDKWYMTEIQNHRAERFSEENPGTYKYLSLFGSHYTLTELRKFLNSEVVWSQGFKLGIIAYMEERKEELIKYWMED